MTHGFMSARGFDKLLQVVGYHVVYGLEQGSAEMILRASGGKVPTGWNWNKKPTFTRQVVTFFQRPGIFFCKERTHIMNQTSKMAVDKMDHFSTQKENPIFFFKRITIFCFNFHGPSRFQEVSFMDNPMVDWWFQIFTRWILGGSSQSVSG